MARNVRDLRDLICVSRLSITDYQSDDSLSGSGCEYSDPQSDSDSRPGNETSSTDQEHGENPSMELDQKRRESDEDRREESRGNEIVIGRPSSAIGTVPKPRTKNLPTCRLVQSERKKYNLRRPLESRVSFKQAEIFSDNRKISVLLEYVDATVIGDMVTRCTKKMNTITTWLLSADNFVRFCHFYLSELSIEQRNALIKLEYSIVKDELSVAFSVGLKDGMVQDCDLDSLMQLALPEYPNKLVRSKSENYLLKALYKLCNVEAGSSKSFLSNIKYSTRNKNHIQWILGIRAFSIISIADGVLQFYEKVVAGQLLNRKNLELSCSHTAVDSILNLWTLISIQLGFADVLMFLVKHLKVDISKIKDQYNRSALMIAVMAQQVDILSYMLTTIKQHLNVNEVSETGNTALHIAVSKENINMVKVLLGAGANPNAKNVISDGGTPLHSAILNGNLEMVQVLVENGADVHSTVGETQRMSSISLATDIGEEQIAKYLRSQIDNNRLKLEL